MFADVRVSFSTGNGSSQEVDIVIDNQNRMRLTFVPIDWWVYGFLKKIHQVNSVGKSETRGNYESLAFRAFVWGFAVVDVREFSSGASFVRLFDREN